MKPFNETRYHNWREIRKKRRRYLIWEPTLYSLLMLLFFLLFRNQIFKIWLVILLFLISPYFISGLVWHINENKYKEYKKNNKN